MGSYGPECTYTRQYLYKKIDKRVRQDFHFNYVLQTHKMRFFPHKISFNIFSYFHQYGLKISRKKAEQNFQTELLESIV